MYGEMLYRRHTALTPANKYDKPFYYLFYK